MRAFYNALRNKLHKDWQNCSCRGLHVRGGERNGVVTVCAGVVIQTEIQRARQQACIQVSQEHVQ
jgi:hypothetical protein